MNKESDLRKFVSEIGNKIFEYPHVEVVDFRINLSDGTSVRFHRDIWTEEAIKPSGDDLT